MTKLNRQQFLTGSLLLTAGAATAVHARPSNSIPAPADKPSPSRAQTLFGDLAPKMAELTDEVLYGDIWARDILSKRDRSLVTIAALVALNRPDQLRSHISLGLEHGLTQDEIVETLTHLAFYAGWPAAVSSLAVAKDIFKK